MSYSFADRTLQILDRASQIGAERYRLSFDAKGDATTRWQRLADIAVERISIQRELEDMYASN
jgi:hypothetical protein